MVIDEQWQIVVLPAVLSSTANTELSAVTAARDHSADNIEARVLRLLRGHMWPSILAPSEHAWTAVTLICKYTTSLSTSSIQAAQTPPMLTTIDASFTCLYQVSRDEMVTTTN